MSKVEEKMIEIIQERTVIDETGKAIAARIRSRAELGKQKYGETLEETKGKYSILYWLNHALEEALDLNLYLKMIEDESPTHELKYWVQKQIIKNADSIIYLQEQIALLKSGK